MANNNADIVKLLRSKVPALAPLNDEEVDEVFNDWLSMVTEGDGEELADDIDIDDEIAETFGQWASVSPIQFVVLTRGK